jgi:hypothetical protein
MDRHVPVRPATGPGRVLIGSSRRPAARAQRIVTRPDSLSATDRHARRSNRHAARSCPSGTDRHAAARPIPPRRWRERNGSSHALVSRRVSALARRVPLRGGRNARPVSSGPSGPTRGQAGAPAGRQTPQERPSWARTWRPRTNELDAGACRAGWYSRRVRASAERGRVQGPGRAEADLGPRTVPGVLLLDAIPAAAPGRSTAISRPPRLPPGSVPRSPP